MGIITGDIRPTGKTSIGATEFVRTKSFQENSNTITSAKESLTLTDKCVIYRNVI